MRIDNDILDGRFEYRQSGYMQLRSELARVLSVTLFLSAAILTVLSVVFWTWAMQVDFSQTYYLNYVAPVFLLLLTAIGGAALWITSLLMIRRWLKGGRYHYEANDEELRIEFKDRTDVIKYDNVLSVNFKELHSFGLARSLRVTVQTVLGDTYKYCYVPPYKGLLNHPEDSPFYALIRKRRKVQNGSDIRY